MIVKGAGSLLVPGAGPLRYVSGWHYPLNSGVVDPGTQTLTTTNTRIYYMPFYVFESHLFTLATVYNSGTGDDGDDVRFAIYSHHRSYGPRTLKLDFGEITFDGTADSQASEAGEAYLTRGWWWGALHCNGAADMYAIRSRVASSQMLRGQNEIGVPSVTAAAADDANFFPYVDSTYGAFATNAVAPTDVTSIVPKVWLKAG